MKQKFYFLVALIFSAPLFAQDFALIYEPIPEEGDILSEDYIIIRDVYETTNSDLVAGFDLMSDGVPAAGIMKTDKDGAVIWSKTLEIPASLAGCTFEVAENAHGNFYLWGLSKEEETNHMRAILSEVSSDGEMLWSKEYDFGTNVATAYTINKLEVMPSGDLQMMIAVFQRVIVLRTNAYGEIIWGKASAMGPPDGGGKNPGFEWLAVPDDGGMCASKAENDFSLLRYNNDGELLWNRAFKLGGYTHGKSIARSTNGNILISGFIDYQPHIMELSDEDGSIVWVKTFNDMTLPFLGKSHLSVVDGTIYLDFTTNTNEQYIFKMSEAGDVLQTMKAKFPVMDYNKLEFVETDEVYFYGSVDMGAGHNGMIHRTTDVLTETCMIGPAENATTSEFTDYSEVDFTPFEYDFTTQEDMEISLIDLNLRVKYACDVVLSTEDSELSQIAVYPNPSANNVVVNFTEDLVDANYVLSDLSGKQLFSDKVNVTQMELDLSDLSNGQYILSIQTERGLVTEKITVLR